MKPAEPIQLSFLLSLRNAESQLAGLVRDCQGLAGALAPNWPHGTRPAESKTALRFEIVVLEPSSTDNSSAVLSVLQTQIPELRRVEGLKPGRAFARGSQIARGSHWLISDRAFQIADARWALEQIVAGKRAASVAGELLVIEAQLGQQLLAWLQGGLASAQRQVNAHFQPSSRRAQIAWKKPLRWGFRRRVVQALRSRLGRVGLAGLDRPRRDH